MTTDAQRNIQSTRRAACRTGNPIKEQPIKCIVMPGYSLLPSQHKVDVLLTKLTSAQLMDIVQGLLMKQKS